MRCFISLDLNDETVRNLIELQRKINGDVKLVEPYNFHVNLKFLGDVSDSKINEIKAVMDAIASMVKRFEIEISGTGCFPTERNPRVIWAGVNGDFSFQRQLDTALSRIGFPPEDRPFRPHITLARVRSGRVNVPPAVLIGKVLIDRMVLKKSDLGQSGPTYSDVHVALFR